MTRRRAGPSPSTVGASTTNESAPPLEALTTWLRAFSAYTTTCRGLKGLLAAVDQEPHREVSAWTEWWHKTLLPAAASLVERAQQAGAVRNDMTTRQILRLVNAVALAHEQAGLPDDPALLNVVIEGLRSRPGPDATS